MNKQFLTLLFFVFIITYNLNAQALLRSSSVSFPDTVIIGQTALLKGYIVNEGNNTFQNPDFKINIDIETVAPLDILADNEIDEINSLGNVNILTGDSIYFEKNIFINSNTFESQTIDLIVIWPTGIDVSDINNSASLRLTYVKEVNTANNFSDFSFLPQTILNYLNVYFENDTILFIETNQTNYEIYLSNGVEINFTLEGVFVEIENEGSDDDDDEFFDNDSADDDSEYDSDDDDSEYDSDDDDSEYDSDDDDSEYDSDDDDSEYDSDDDDSEYDSDDDDSEYDSDDDDSEYDSDDDDYEFSDNDSDDDEAENEITFPNLEVENLNNLQNFFTLENSINLIVKANNHLEINYFGSKQLHLQKVLIYDANGSIIATKQISTSNLELLSQPNLKVCLVNLIFLDDNGNSTSFTKKVLFNP